MTIEKLHCKRCGKIWLWNTDSGNPLCDDMFGCGAKIVVEHPLFTIMNVSGGWQVDHVWREAPKSLYSETILKFKSLDGAVNYVRCMQEIVK